MTRRGRSRAPTEPSARPTSSAITRRSSCSTGAASMPAARRLAAPGARRDLFEAMKGVAATGRGPGRADPFRWAAPSNGRRIEPEGPDPAQKPANPSFPRQGSSPRRSARRMRPRGRRPLWPAGRRRRALCRILRHAAVCRLEMRCSRKSDVADGARHLNLHVITQGRKWKAHATRPSPGDHPPDRPIIREDAPAARRACSCRHHPSAVLEMACRRLWCRAQGYRAQREPNPQIRSDATSMSLHSQFSSLARCSRTKTTLSAV